MPRPLVPPFALLPRTIGTCPPSLVTQKRTSGPQAPDTINPLLVPTRVAAWGVPWRRGKEQSCKNVPKL